MNEHEAVARTRCAVPHRVTHAPSCYWRMRHAVAVKAYLFSLQPVFCNSISVAEHVVMMFLGLVRNYIPLHDWVRKGGWNIADCVARSYDVERMHVGTVAAGRIGLAVLKRLKPFDMHLHYTDRHRLPEAVEKEFGLTWHDTREDMTRSATSSRSTSRPILRRST